MHCLSSVFYIVPRKFTVRLPEPRTRSEEKTMLIGSLSNKTLKNNVKDEMTLFRHYFCKNSVNHKGWDSLRSSYLKTDDSASIWFQKIFFNIQIYIYCISPWLSFQSIFVLYALYYILLDKKICCAFFSKKNRKLNAIYTFQTFVGSMYIICKLPKLAS